MIKAEFILFQFKIETLEQIVPEFLTVVNIDDIHAEFGAVWGNW